MEDTGRGRSRDHIRDKNCTRRPTTCAARIRERRLCEKLTIVCYRIGRTRVVRASGGEHGRVFHCYQAQSLIDVMSLDLFYVVEKHLPVMASTNDACLLLEKNLTWTSAFA